MRVQKFRISKPKEYTHNGEQKTFWQNVGEITKFINDDGSTKGMKLEIYAIGLVAQVFPQEDRKENNQGQAPAPAESSAEEINPKDIPF